MPKTELAKVLGERIRMYRKNKKLSQEELAHLSNTHPTYIGQIERGEKNVTIDTLEKVVNALQISLEELFRFSSLGNDLNDTIIQLNSHLTHISKEDRDNLLKVIDVLIDWNERSNSNNPMNKLR
ncbi:helix-turn-helix domain-containing protein [Aquibacillus kalidii]|uniref:helix-turn-helix domain-containing protein n=1 Tax=Aquibacillus kalidii TaxID=2762597 RepID=UPI001645B2D4|nr:helix-turn-helix transcriptional regulator [Aquibacillus kalidii]